MKEMSGFERDVWFKCFFCIFYKYCSCFALAVVLLSQYLTSIQEERERERRNQKEKFDCFECRCNFNKYPMYKNQP